MVKAVMPLVLAAALLFAACGNGNDNGDEAVPPAGGPGQTVTVAAVDYDYPDLPSEIAAGTNVVLRNDSTAEVHEILAFRLADGETRSADELVALPVEEFMAAAEMTGVALAPPGSSSTETPAPPLVLEQTGRYVFACFIPADAPPDDVMAAVAEFIEAGEPEGGPDYPQTGPPHAARGMYAEVRVSAS